LFAKNGGNGQYGGVAIGPGSDTNGEGDVSLGGTTHPGRSTAIGPQCFNQPGR